MTLYAFLYALGVVVALAVITWATMRADDNLVTFWRAIRRTRAELNIIDSHSNRPARTVPLWQSVGDRK